MDSEYILMPNGELYHWGIKGMKWGVRRYQTKDGSLTPAGKKRYNKDMEKIKAETKKLKAQERTDKKLSKLEEAKANLKALKGRKKSPAEGSDKKDENVETDEQKRERILKAPSAKDVYENRHLFTNKEIQDLSLRLNNENAIKNLVPKEVDAGKARTDAIMSKIGDATANAVTLAKAWNMTANVLNAFGKFDISIPKIDTDITKGNKVTRKEEKKKKKAAEDEKKKAEKEAEEARKKEADDKARDDEMKKYEEYNKKYTDPPKSGTSTFTDTEYRNKGGERTDTGRKNSDDTVHEGEVIGIGKSSSKHANKNNSNNKKPDIIDAADSYASSYSDSSYSDFISNQSANSSGQSYVSGFLNSPISGLLPPPKDDD